MKVLERGHVYEVNSRTPAGDRYGKPQTLQFVNRQPGQEHDGATTQEVIRVLLDRTRHCANCMPHRNNEQIIYHLRMALVLHEARALERKLEKGLIEPEYFNTGHDGHFLLSIPEKSSLPPDSLLTTELIPHRNDWDRPCNHPSAPAPVINKLPAKRKR